MDSSTLIRIIAGILLLFLIWLYFLPTWVARRREHPDTTAIFVVNLLFGWCLLGWGIALIWAVKNRQTQPVYVVNSVPVYRTDAPGQFTGARNLIPLQSETREH